MADLKKTLEVIFEGTDNASRKAADVLGKIREMETAAKDAASKADQLEGSLNRVGQTERAISAVNAALAAFATAQVFKAFVDANVNIEKFEAGLRAVQGASSDSGAQLNYVRDTANRLGLELSSTATSFLQLSAATQGTQLQGKETRVIFEAVATAMGALGRSSSDTESAFKAIEQIVSKGKVSMEELRGQLGDRLPGAMQIAARAMGVTTAEFESLVKQGLSAEEFLPRFASELNKTFSGASFDGYNQELNRLRNSIDDLLVQAGKAGLFDALKAGIDGATTVIKQAAVETTFWGAAWDATARLFRNGDLEEFGRGITFAENKAELLAATLEAKTNQSLAETNRLMRESAQAAAEAFKSDQSDAESARLLRLDKSLSDAAKSATELDALLKRLGVDPKKTTEAIKGLADDLEALANNPRSNGELFSQAFSSAIKRATTTANLRTLEDELLKLTDAGLISTQVSKKGLEELSAAYAKVDGSLKGAAKSSDEHAKQVAKEEEQMRKAAEQAQRFTLEMEKLASNERIKNIEAKVKLNVAEVEAQTKRIEAAFDSIKTTIDSTGGLLGDLFGSFKDYDNLSYSAIRAIEKQINLENDRRQDALNLQKDLIRAQIDQLRAQSRAVEKGDSVIKIDGAGLQPHLEAFMWEILRQIQIRVNSDGLKLLLGV